mmetsp:Transcript_115486/g.331474  ORF Transcript_115486/g.331474 Transcript_115486/m.331474 type:complete len:124 (+) Transcript_115486:1423-1794(+)
MKRLAQLSLVEFMTMFAERLNLLLASAMRFKRFSDSNITLPNRVTPPIMEDRVEWRLPNRCGRSSRETRRPASPSAEHSTSASLARLPGGLPMPAMDCTEASALEARELRELRPRGEWLLDEE